MDAIWATGPSSPRSFHSCTVRPAFGSVVATAIGGSPRQLYSIAPSRCCSGVKKTLKSALKSLPPDEAQLNDQPMRSRKASSLASGARDTVQKATSWFSRCGTTPL